MSEKKAGPVMRVMSRPAEIPPRISLYMELKCLFFLGVTRGGSNGEGEGRGAEVHAETQR